MYQLGYRCDVTGAQMTTPLPKREYSFPVRGYSLSRLAVKHHGDMGSNDESVLRWAGTPCGGIDGPVAGSSLTWTSRWARSPTDSAFRTIGSSLLSMEADLAALVSRKCDYPHDVSNCTVGAKQPHYWLQAESVMLILLGYT